jgi:hypothetical protein
MVVKNESLSVLDFDVDAVDDEEGTTEDESLQERIEEIQASISAQLEEAIAHYEENLEPIQVEATDYYHARPFGDEEKGRSKVVSSDLRDTTAHQVPSLMRVFLGPEKAVEFRAERPEDAQGAKQATDYINHVIREDHPAFLIFNAAFKDLLVRKLGVLKWWWEEFSRVEESTHEGLNAVELQVLTADEEVEVLGDVQEYEVDGVPLYNLRIRRTKSYGCEKFDCIPSEEFFITPNARSRDEAALVAHVRDVPRDQLIAMGIDEDELDELENHSRTRNETTEGLAYARQYHDGGTAGDTKESVDPSQRPILYGEVYALVDGDGDGIAERRLFKVIGADFQITNFDEDGIPGEIVDEVPFAVGTMDPEGHTIVGLCNYDYTKDIQRIKSQVWRETLNSLGKAVEPVTVINWKDVNLADLTNPDVKGVVRTRGDVNTSIREVAHSFVGQYTLPVLAELDNILESRTGSKGGQGIDADTLQSSTKAAVAATLTASQQRIEFIARAIAETLIAPLFKGLLRLSIRHRNPGRMIRLRNEYVPVDPRHWNADMDVHINVGVGQGLAEDRILILKEVAADIKEQLAAGSPLASYAKYRNVLAKVLELGGWTNPDEFYEPWSDEDEANMRQQRANQPPSDPAMALVQVEQMKAQAQIQLQAQKLAMEKEKMQMEADLARDKAAHEMYLEELKLQYEHNREVNRARAESEVARIRASLDADVKREKIATEAAVAVATAPEPEATEE